VINAFACAIAAGCFGRHTYNPDEANHFFPSLADASSTSTVIISWIKNHSTSSNNKEYEHFGMAGLPEEPTAAGMRVGHINEMAAKGVCAESTLAVSGHDAEKLSTLWHYISLALAALVPGARVLAGWAAPPYGQLGAGPTTAPFGAIAEPGVTMTSLGILTDRMLHLEPGLAPPAMLDGGELRPFALAMAAALVMYYEDHDRAIGRLLLAYVDLEKETVKPLKTWKELTVNSLSDRLEELDKAAHKPKGRKFYRMLLAEIVPQKDAARLDELVALKPKKDTARNNKPQPPVKKAKF